jgi:hypothetical protein
MTKAEKTVKKILIGVSGSLLIGALSLFGNGLIDIAVLKTSVSNLEFREQELQKTLQAINEHINDIHWFLIKRKNVKLPVKKRIVN